MLFNHILSAITLTVLAVAGEGMAQQVTYRGYTSTVQCSGTNFWCRDEGLVCCGPFPVGFAFSAQFENLPAGTRGEGFTDACRSVIFSVFGPGTKCWNGGGRRANWLEWFHSAGRLPEQIRDGSGEGCVPPSGFTYQDGQGVEHSIQVPAGQANATEVIAQQFLNKDWKALAAYQTI
ncbi:hypothetical protein NMY22_g6107 [Coprinellus aureogranulatus]|nr:hypothetical protein NMY22_g6107 [Coprinellus aureogranulatus]